MADPTLVDQDHPLLLQLKASRDALARFQEEAHQSAVKLQRHSLDSARTHERAARLERENELLKNELSILRDSDAAQNASTSQTLVQELTLSLRKLSEKLTLTEEVLLEKTTSLVAAETEAIKARAAQDSAYELGATVRGREEAMKLKEHELQLRISTLEEQLRMSDAVLGEYAALVREMEGRAKTSTDSVTPTKLLRGRFDLQHLVDRFQAEIADALQELESTRSLLDIANAKLSGSRKGEESMLADYGRTRVELDKLKIDDGTAAKMVARYMQFSQSATNALLTSLETLKARHNATVSTLTSQSLSLSSQLRSLEAQNEHLRTSLDDLGGEIIKEKYGRRREVAQRIRMGGREERVAEGLRRWIRKGDEALARVEAAGTTSGDSVDEGSLQTAYEGLLSMSQDARILLSGLDHGGADEDSALSFSGSKAREILTGHGLQGLLEELRTETQRRVWLEVERWKESKPLPNGQAAQGSTTPIRRSTKENSTLPPLPLEDVASDEQGLRPTTTASRLSSDEPLVNGQPGRAEELSEIYSAGLLRRIEGDNGSASSERAEAHSPPRNEDQTLMHFDETGSHSVHLSNPQPADAEVGQDGPPESNPRGLILDRLSTHNNDADPPLCVSEQDTPTSAQIATSDYIAVVAPSHGEPSRSEPTHSPPNASPFAAGLHLSEADAPLLHPHSSQEPFDPVDQEAVASEDASTASDEPAHPVAKPSFDNSQQQQPLPSVIPSLALLAELPKVSSRYDNIQRAFRDCHIALQSLQASISASSSTSSSIPTEVLIAVVNRLDDYTEDARVELEIRISDEELLAKGYEALLSVPGALTQLQASNGRKDEDLTEDHVLKQIALFVDGTDPLVQKARETFGRKLEDVQHDIAALKRAVFDPESPSEPNTSTSPTIISPAPTIGNGGGWTSWIRGTPSRPTTPTPGMGPSPTFGDIMTAPKLRHSSSFGPGQHTNGSTPHLPTSLQGNDRSRRSSFFGSLVSLGSDHSTKKDPLDGLSLRVPMPNFTNLGPFSPASSGPTSAGFNSSIMSPGLSALSPGIGTMSMNGAASRSRISPPMYMMGLGGQIGKGSPAITNGMKMPFATRSFSATSLNCPPTKTQGGTELPAVADEGVE